jgi:hypothetical protein
MLSISVLFRNSATRNGMAFGPVTEDDGLRVHDLVAKTARVTLKDTIRVMLAVKKVSEALGKPEAEIVSRPFSVVKPNQANAEACEATYQTMIEWFKSANRMSEISTLRAID